MLLNELKFTFLFFQLGAVRPCSAWLFWQQLAVAARIL